jgi:hypothetical protein
LVKFNLLSVENDNVFLELKVWKMKITSQDFNIKKGLEVFFSCPKIDFPNIHFFIHLFYTLPVSITLERFFLTLTRLKIYL